MTLSCVTEHNFEHYVHLEEELVTSPNTEFCAECGELIHAFEPHYKAIITRVLGERYDDEPEYIGQHKCCEECGDLILSLMELGYCWSHGNVRDDIKEMNDDRY